MAPQSKQKRDGVISDLHSKTKPAMANYESEAYEIIDTDEIVQSLEMATKEITEVFDVSFFYLNHKICIFRRKFEFTFLNYAFSVAADYNSYTVEPFEMGQTAVDGKATGKSWGPFQCS